jgi:glycosyltransferase involved in cell wall biosynthesis
MADVAILPLRDNAFLRGTLPAKMFDFWACGTPLLIAADGELRDLVERAAGGISVAPGNSEELAEAIVNLRSAPDRCRAMGQNGLQFVRAHYNRENQAQEFVRLLECVVAAKRSFAAVGQ